MKTPHRRELALEPVPDSAREARDFLRRALEDWDAEEHEWNATQALSELVTNAVLHAGTSFVVALELREDRCLRMEVRDGSRMVPRQRRYGVSATTGRGIALVDGLSKEWGVERYKSGKTVWCTFVECTEDEAAASDPDLSAFLTSDELADLSP